MLEIASPSSAATSLAINAVVKGKFYDEALDPMRPGLYLTSYSDNSLVVINTTSNKPLANLFVGPGPTGLAVSANGEELYVALSGDSALAVVNPNTLSVGRTNSTVVFAV
jgi:YVTN family beta-propeller protein